ncbi:MAG: hypothetical protein PHF97_10330 [Bacteroidales bacterium]|nr:hypothetical protein [Bacteroidales bacterium]
METNNNSENNTNTKKSFGHFLLIFVGFILALIGISYAVMAIIK